MEHTLREVIENAHRYLDDTQWERIFDSRRQEYVRECTQCSASAVGDARATLQHREDCPLAETLRELDVLAVALSAKEEAKGESEQVVVCSHAWQARMSEQERDLQAKVAAAEKRAEVAEARHRELYDAMRAFVNADGVLREALKRAEKA